MAMVRRIANKNSLHHHFENYISDKFSLFKSLLQLLRHQIKANFADCIKQNDKFYREKMKEKKYFY